MIDVEGSGVGLELLGRGVAARILQRGAVLSGAVPPAEGRSPGDFPTAGPVAAVSEALYRTATGGPAAGQGPGGGTRLRCRLSCRNVGSTWGIYSASVSAGEISRLLFLYSALGASVAMVLPE